MSGESSDHRTVQRVDGILDVVTRSPHALTLSEIAAALPAPVSSTKDLLEGLVAHGYLIVSSRRYSAGPRAQVLALVGGWTRPHGIDRRRLLRCSAVARAPVLLAVLAGPHVHYLDQAGPRAPARLQDAVDLHPPRPALRTAAGRLLLALGPETPPAVATALASGDPDGYRGYLGEREAIRRSRVARSDGLADPDIRAIAVPAHADATVTAAFVVVGRRRGSNDRSLTLDAAARRLVADVGGRARQ